MATIVDWPAGIPNCPQTWDEQFIDNVVRSDSDDAILKTRLRYTRSRIKGNATLVLIKDDYLIFKNWFRNDLGQGSLAFRYPDPTTGVDLVWKFNANPQVSYSGKSAKISWSMQEEVV